MNKLPPKYPLRFFRWFCHPDYVEDIEGDLMERFDRRPSRWHFTLEVLKLFRPGIIKQLEGSRRLHHYGMFKHYLKISYRNLIRRKSFAALNIGGLVMGLSIFLLIGLWIWDELSFNTENEYYDRVAMVRIHETINGRIQGSVTVPHPLPMALQTQYGSDFEHIVSSTWFGDKVVSYDDKAITAYGGFMEEGAPDLMSLNMIQGNRNSLSSMGSALLSESLAKALFGDEDPVGKTIQAHRNWSMTVTGIFEDIPSSSSFHRVNFIGSWKFYRSVVSWRDTTSWHNSASRLYTQLKPGVKLEDVNEKIGGIILSNLPEQDKIYNTKVFLHPMSDWHLRSNWEDGVQKGGDIQYVWWFGIIGSFVLLLACVNYMNLSTAQSINRAKEVGIRKAIGTMRRQLVVQFQTESILIVFISFLLAAIITHFTLPYFNVLTSKEIELPFGSSTFWMFGVGLSLFIGLVSGSYPSFYLSSFNATQVLKGTYQNSLSAAFFRKFLVAFQFTIAVILIIGTLIVTQQINYASNRTLGYDQDGAISIQMTAGEQWQTNEVFKNDLLSSGLITHFTNASAPLTGVWTTNGDISWEGMDPSFQPWFCTYHVNHNYGQTINWEIVEGRDFSIDLASDSSALIINETAAKYMNMDNPIGQPIKWSENYRIIGVVKDLLIESPFSEVRPTIYKINRGQMSNFQLLKLNPNIPMLDAITGIEEIQKSHLPKVPFKFDFINDLHNKKFAKIERLGNLSQVFAALAVLISCLGLFGLAAFMVEQRTKEIGIRKVLGAPILALWKMVSMEFVMIVLIACVIAIPVGYFGMNVWLNNYEYRTSINGWIFFLACALTLLITLITVSIKSMKVVHTNPAEILKDE